MHYNALTMAFDQNVSNCQERAAVNSYLEKSSTKYFYLVRQTVSPYPKHYQVEQKTKGA